MTHFHTLISLRCVESITSRCVHNRNGDRFGRQSIRFPSNPTHNMCKATRCGAFPLQRPGKPGKLLRIGTLSGRCLSYCSSLEPWYVSGTRVSSQSSAHVHSGQPVGDTQAAVVSVSHRSGDPRREQCVRVAVMCTYRIMTYCFVVCVF